MNEQNMNNTYPEQVKDDFEEYFGEQYHQAKSDGERYELFLKALDSDDVTGNGSGSYYMNRSKAREMVLANIEYIANGISDDEWTTMQANGLSNGEWTTTHLEDYIANDGWETLDVITRYSTLVDLQEHDEL